DILRWFGRGFRFFFFQAEDGIRDLIVTGVQTCALPISRRSPRGARLSARAAAGARFVQVILDEVARLEARAVVAGIEPLEQHLRSEERRVGKECRSGWARGH